MPSAAPQEPEPLPPETFDYRPLATANSQRDALSGSPNFHSQGLPSEGRREMPDSALNGNAKGLDY